MTGKVWTRRGALGAITALALASCGPQVTTAADSSNPPSYKYRLTATVETPQGERSGHSVIAVWWRSPSPIFGTQGSAGFTVKGEAVAVDLPKGQTLFVLLRSAANVDWAAYAHESVPVPMQQGAKLADWMQAIARDHGIYPINRRRETVVEDSDNYPYFVRFRDIADPKSVEQVDPDDLAKSFGAGYRLKSLTVQMTDEALTAGIGKRLGWLSRIRGPLDGQNLMYPDGQLSNRITSGDFRQGKNQ